MTLAEALALAAPLSLIGLLVWATVHGLRRTVAPERHYAKHMKELRP